MDMTKTGSGKIRTIYLTLSGLLMLLALIAAVIKQIELTFVLVVLASLVMILGSQIASKTARAEKLKKLK